MATQALGRGLRTGLSALPIASTENVAKAEEMYAPSRARATEAMAEQALLGEGVSFAKGEEARAKESLAQKVREAGAESLRLAAEEEKGLVDVAKQEKEKNPFPTFSPTQEDAMSYGQLGSMIATLGVMLGAGGKASAKAAIGSMTGMMNGWKQGRKDLWEKEAKTFEKEVNRIKMVRDSITKDLETGLKLASTNRAASKASLEAAAHKAGSGSVLASMIATGRAVDALELAKKSANLAKETDNKILDMATRQTQHKAQLDAAERQRQATLEAARIRAEAAKDKTAAKSGISKTAEDNLSAKMSLLKEYDKLIEEYKQNKPVLTAGQRKALLAAKTIGIASAQESVMEFGRSDPKNNPNAAAVAEFIGKLERIIAPDRHSLYGASLTVRELPRYERTIPTAIDSPETVLKLLEGNRDSILSAIENKEAFYKARGVDLNISELYDSSKDFSATYSRRTRGATNPAPTPDVKTAKDIDKKELRSKAAAKIAAGASHDTVSKRFKELTGEDY